MRILATRKTIKTQDLEELLVKRLDYFIPQGLEVDFNYKAKIKYLEDLAMEERALNRIVYNIFSIFLVNNQKLKIEVKNCNRFLTLSLSCRNSGFLSLKNGFSLPSSLRSSSSHWDSVHTLVRESGGKLTFSHWPLAGPNVCLQIPLCLFSEDQWPSIEGFFISAYCLGVL